jgi:hypothetical protein
MKSILKLNNLVWDINSEIASLNDTKYVKGEENSSHYFEYGRHALFINDPHQNFGYKFFIIKGICYELSKIKELYYIHLLMFSGGFGVNVYGICSCYYESKLHYGLLVEKLSKISSTKQYNFPKKKFQSFCRTVKGLIKREKYFEELYGNEWYKIYPNLEFNVGNNNIMYNSDGLPKLIDIDPRWEIKKKNTGQ